MTQNVDRETVVSRLLGTDDILILCHKNPGRRLPSARALRCAGTAAPGQDRRCAVAVIPFLPCHADHRTTAASPPPCGGGGRGIQLFGDHNNIRITPSMSTCASITTAPTAATPTKRWWTTARELQPRRAADRADPQDGRGATPEIAACLYTGVATDTGCFRFTNTTANTHLAAAC